MAGQFCARLVPAAPIRVTWPSGLVWLTERGTEVLATGRVHADLWATAQRGGAEASSVRRRRSALSSFYRYCAAHDLTGRNPVARVARPVVDPECTTTTIGLDRDQAGALLATGMPTATPGPRRCASPR